MKEYKVYTQDDLRRKRRIDSVALENVINTYASDGWIVKSIITTSQYNVYYIDQTVIIFEREIKEETIAASFLPRL